MTPASESPNTLPSSSRGYTLRANSIRVPPDSEWVGNICNAVLSGLAACKGIPRFKVYTAVVLPDRKGTQSMILTFEDEPWTNTVSTLCHRKFRSHSAMSFVLERVVLKVPGHD